MSRHMLLAALWVAFGLVWLPFAAEAQQAKLHRLGFLANQSPSWPTYQTFLQTLRELGYVEGKNIAIEARYAVGNFDRLPELARELVRLDVDLLFVSGDQGVKAAKQATDTIPILLVACDPLESLVVSIMRPVGKATGVTCISSELAGKRLQTLKEIVPALVRVAVLYNPDDRNKSLEGKKVQEAAHSVTPPLMAADDVAYFAQSTPTLFFWAGITPPDQDIARAAPNHSPLWRVDEAGLLPGLRSVLHIWSLTTPAAGESRTNPHPASAIRILYPAEAVRWMTRILHIRAAAVLA